LCQEGPGSGFGGFAEEDDGWTASPEPDIPLQVPGRVLLQETSVRIHIHLIRIRILQFRLNTDPKPILIQGFDYLKLNWLPERTSKLQ
jgi:hypothetical protein